MTSAHHQAIVVLDYGSQYTKLIARRIREQSVLCEILPCDSPADRILARSPAGVILSGGPDSVDDDGAPGLDPRLLEGRTPVLGICYGMQLIARQLGGGIERSGRREYGHAEVEPERESTLLEGLAVREPVWMSHGDEVVEVPRGFRITARTPAGAIAAMEDPGRALFGLQFHPEVANTPRGGRILRNFVYGICRCTGDWTMASFAEEVVERLRGEIHAGERVLCGVSGGVDSTVTATLIHRAIGGRLLPLFIDTGLLRKGEAAEVLGRFRKHLHIEVRHADASGRFVEALRGVTDPEHKRRVIGEVFVRVFEEEARAAGGARYLAQGTLYPDRIESFAVRGPSATIKTHHNVGGLPGRMDFELVEPLRDLFKDEVRSLAREIGLDDSLVARHPFPGPGLAVRIPGEVTPERIRLLQEADAIFLEEISRAGLYDQVAQAFAVLLPVKTVGVMGDARTYESVLALRAVDTSDFMTASWSRLPHDLLAHVSSRIVNEVRGINRVVYDISSKPPATIEWE